MRFNAKINKRFAGLIVDFKPNDEQPVWQTLQYYCYLGYHNTVLRKILLESICLLRRKIKE